MNKSTSRRSFLRDVGFGSLGAVAAGGLAAPASAQAPDEEILGAEGVKTAERPKGVWQPVSDRRIRVGVVGHGVCQMGVHFGFHNHPNVTVAAVSDLIPDRCRALAQACRCEKTYPSLAELLKDDTIEVVFLATDAPSHAKQCIDVLEHGKHVGCCVPAIWESLEEAHKLFDTVRSSGLKYMMFETSAFHQDCHAMRQIYRADGFGKLIYTEGEYFHYACSVIDSYKGWRIGMPPQWYPTHSTAYYVGVAGGSFTEVSCMGMPSIRQELQPANNRYQNPFGTEIALLRTSEGGMARMGVAWDIQGSGGEVGRVRGERGTMLGMSYVGALKQLPDLTLPPLPPSVAPGGHGGSHGPLTNEFITAILEDRKPYLDIVLSLNMTVAGTVAHQSALKDGENMKIPQYA